MVATVAMTAPRAVAAEAAAVGVAPLPLATQRLAASAEECVVWRRERSFARSVEAVDQRGWTDHLAPGVIFNVGTGDALRGLDEVTKSWPGMSGQRSYVLRWRPGIVMIGGDPRIAVSRGPYIVQSHHKDGSLQFEVGFYQTVWVRKLADDLWRVLFDGEASTSQPMPDRAAADTWVAAQVMSGCDEGAGKP